MSIINSMAEVIYKNRNIFIYLVFFSCILMPYHSLSNQKPNKVSSIDYIKNSQNETIIIYTSNSTEYKLGEVPANKYDLYRIYIDFKDTELSREIPKILDLNDSVVKRIRFGQFDDDTARVVFDLFNDQTRFEVLSFDDPKRVEISFSIDAGDQSGEDTIIGDINTGDKEQSEPAKVIETRTDVNKDNLNELVDLEQSNGEEVFDPDAKPPLPIKIRDYLSLGGKVNLNLDWRDNSEDLDSSKGDTLTRFESQLSIAGLLTPTRDIDIYGEGRFTNLQLIEDELDIEDEDTDPELIRAYIHWRGFLVNDFDIQAGRQRFKDDREWIYDEYLDAFRIYYKPNKFSIELSLSSILIDLQDEKDKTVNYILYSQYEYDKDERLAFFSVIRQDLNITDDTYTFGASWRGRPLNRRNKIWIDNAVFIGRNRDDRWTQGYGIDVGLSKSFKKPLKPNFTIASAFGSKNFRQTGLEDNNSMFKGVTKFKYYGEVFDPELSNLFIGTFGLGTKPHKKSSLDLVYHYFYQVDKRDKLISTDIDLDPTGESRDIGHELDMIIGTSISKYVKLALVGGMFFPGDAFEENDTAYFGEVELQFSLK